ncbi:MAG: recombinase family protein [Microthrixaceae bacterium]|nr:recombinase family protein [Microthrixaceae bacterium]
MNRSERSTATSSGSPSRCSPTSASSCGCPRSAAFHRPRLEAHDLVMSLYGGMSKGERTRIKTRVRSAMASQAAIEGRFLGGRPPYGYLLGDAGPHPNPSKAANGQRLRRLEVDPDRRPRSCSASSTSSAPDQGSRPSRPAFNRDGILSSSTTPSATRTRATGRGRWAKTAVRAIIANPRYTGFEIWNKQRKDEVLVDVDDVALGHQTVMRWNDTSEWIWSPEPMHDAIVTGEQLDAAQAMFSTPKRRPPRQPVEGRHYLLGGLLHCDICGRRMQGQWNHGTAYYRCKYPTDYPEPNGGHSRSVSRPRSRRHPRSRPVARPAVRRRPHRANLPDLAGVSEPDPENIEREERLRAGIADCDRRITKYHQLLDHDVDRRSPPRGSPRPSASAEDTNHSSASRSPASSSAQPGQGTRPSLRTSSAHSPRPT